ncbi:MAG: hypothetical protein ABR520_08615 [Mycobacteriales bacterium]|nr:hypothetical protein [Frankia sp.]
MKRTARIAIVAVLGGIAWWAVPTSASAACRQVTVGNPARGFVYCSSGAIGTSSSYSLQVDCVPSCGVPVDFTLGPTGVAPGPGGTGCVISHHEDVNVKCDGTPIVIAVIDGNEVPIALPPFCIGDPQFCG